MCLSSYMTTKVILTLIVPVYQGLYFAPIYKIFIYIPYKHENKLCKSSVVTLMF
jgi:hypothetical protein